MVTTVVVEVYVKIIGYMLAPEESTLPVQEFFFFFLGGSMEKEIGLGILLSPAVYSHIFAPHACDIDVFSNVVRS